MKTSYRVRGQAKVCTTCGGCTPETALLSTLRAGHPTWHGASSWRRWARVRDELWVRVRVWVWIWVWVNMRVRVTVKTRARVWMWVGLMQLQPRVSPTIEAMGTP